MRSRDLRVCGCCFMPHQEARVIPRIARSQHLTVYSIELMPITILVNILLDAVMSSGLAHSGFEEIRARNFVVRAEA